jgi:hypothetical protein
MKSRINLITFVVIVCFVTVCFGQQAATPGAASPDSSESMQAQPFPYLAEITGNDVQIRTGPGTGFYACGEFQKGDKIQVIGSQFTWSKIVPPPDSFSWISMQYVDIDPEAPSYGIVTGDNVRVWAGKDNLRPSYSTSLQVKLNKGDRVKLLGEQLDDYYKIVPPKGAYLWVSTQFTNKIAPAIEGPMRIAMTPGVDAAQETDMAAMVEEGTMETESDANDTVEVVTETILKRHCLRLPMTKMPERPLVMHRQSSNRSKVMSWL